MQIQTFLLISLRYFFQVAVKPTGERFPSANEH